MRRGARGFTLLEVAIAMAILGVGVVTVLELFSAGLRMEGNAGYRAHAVVYARGLLDQTLALPELRAGNDRGRFDQTFTWEVVVREAPEFTDEAPKGGLSTKQKDMSVKNNPSDLVMYDIEVSVSWPQSGNREGVYAIRTLRLAQKGQT
jgi:prepilin-type N-terminal cleavage/methylation domain-containing protein